MATKKKAAAPKRVIPPQKKGQKPIAFREGGLHASLGVPKGQKIPKEKLRAALAGKYGKKAAAQARLAVNVLKVKAQGGATVARYDPERQRRLQEAKNRELQERAREEAFRNRFTGEDMKSMVLPRPSTAKPVPRHIPSPRDQFPVPPGYGPRPVTPWWRGPGSVSVPLPATPRRWTPPGLAMPEQYKKSPETQALWYLKVAKEHPEYAAPAQAAADWLLKKAAGLQKPVMGRGGRVVKAKAKPKASPKAKPAARKPSTKRR